MRIGIVTAVYTPVQNGVTKIVSLYKKYLEKAGHEATVFTVGKPSLDDERGIIRSPGIAVGQTGYSLAIRYSKFAQRLLGTMDVVHCHHPLMGLELAHRYSRAPILFTNHTRYDLYAGAYLPLPLGITTNTVSQLWPLLVNKSSWIIAPSKSIEFRLKESGVDRPISVIMNGIELEPFLSSPSSISREELGIQQDAVVLIYVGRLSTEKRVDQLLDIYSITRKKLGRTILLLVGGGPQRRQLENLAVQMELSQSVKFIDEVPFYDVPDYLYAADIFVTASDTEVHPLTVIEAMATGLPVVGRHESGLNETVQHGVNGLIQFKNNEEMADAIVKLASKPDLRKRMGKASRQMSKKFHIQNTVAQSIELYRHLVELTPSDYDTHPVSVSPGPFFSHAAEKLIVASRKPGNIHHGRPT